MLTEAVDGFRLAYDRIGEGPAVVLLHGWPGDRTDYRLLAPMLAERGFEVVVPDLRGFGESDAADTDPAQYGVAAQGRSIVGLMEELGLERPVLAGYDVGSRIAQGIARNQSELIDGIVVAPPLPGIGKRVFSEQAQAEFWYQAFHRLPVIEELIDGKPDAVRSYLNHFWTHWSGPGFEPELDHLVDTYSQPGAFTASIQWYRAGAGSVAVSAAETAPPSYDRIAVPTVVLWPEFDPLFPRVWSDRVDDFFSDVRVRYVDGAGHYAPLEYPEVLAEEIVGLG
ncbi:pimeloyl-ACP methyl ester carboxylesterase [Kribbella rubisoli]|uniref:Pimeloyl-ACP methyl ester carboxylesterase n=1 Tax=Kribbella rubisoli TaxID=3075929 RepID=A0A4Q7X9G0_9ACTN|nr:alpha/beta hydrolase [Kribbella rubisoli]RZU19694.1 pimeloyl-ACP methyl ester carboxylesterase [Kribbella rubisoli]